MELNKSVIIDVRSRFDFNMSRLPRSFFADYQDWDLKNYHGNELVEKQKALARLLALNGIDPLVPVVILGKGLQGKGEEFLMAATLTSMGIEKISFMNSEQAKKAIISKNIPPIENVPYWHKDIRPLFHCAESNLTEEQKLKKADILLTNGKEPLKAPSLPPDKIFTPQLKVIGQTFPKNIDIYLYSPNSFWAYGLGLYFKEQGRKPCIL